MEKKTVVISLLVSLIVSLVINLVYLYGSTVIRRGPETAAASPRPSGSGGAARQAQPPSPEVLALYQERAKVLQQKFAEIEASYKAGVVPLAALLKTSIQRDEAQLAAWRRELNLSTRGGLGGPTEAAIRVKALSTLIDELEKQQKSSAVTLADLLDARAELVQAKIRLAEVAARLRDNRNWTQAAGALQEKTYPLQEEALKSLLVAEEMGSPAAPF